MAVAKVTMVKVENKINIGGNQFRPPKRVMLQTSNSPGVGFVDHQEIQLGSSLNPLVPNVVARYIRLVILEVGDEENQNFLPLGITE